jgi:hypothetical protein
MQSINDQGKALLADVIDADNEAACLGRLEALRQRWYEEYLAELDSEIERLNNRRAEARRALYDWANYHLNKGVRFKHPLVKQSTTKVYKYKSDDEIIAWLQEHRPDLLKMSFTKTQVRVLDDLIKAGLIEVEERGVTSVPNDLTGISLDE